MKVCFHHLKGLHALTDIYYLPTFARTNDLFIVKGISLKPEHM